MIFDGSASLDLTAVEIAEKSATERSTTLTEDEVTALLIRQQINTLLVDDNKALRTREFYPEWEAGRDCPVYSDLSDLVGLYVEKGA